MDISSTSRTCGANRVVRNLQTLLLPMLLALLISLPAQAETGATQLSIRITPRAAALIALLQRGYSPHQALANLPPPASRRAFDRGCARHGGAAQISTRDAERIQQRLCL